MMKGYRNRKTYKGIDTIMWVLATIGLIAMVSAYIQLQEIKKDIKELKQKNEAVMGR